MPRLAFFAAGLPAPQGSKIYAVSKAGKAYGRESAAGLPNWRRAVQEAAEAALMASDDWEESYDGPVSVGITFYFPPVASGRIWKTSAPDADKLARAVGDALTKARVYKDDSRIVDLCVLKLHDALTGASIRVATLDTHPIEDAKEEAA